MRDDISKALAQAILNITGKAATGDTIVEVLESLNAQFINAEADKLPADCIAWAPGDTTTKAKANQNSVTVEQIGRDVIIRGKLADLQSYASANAEQGTAKWVCVVFDTKEGDITAVTYNGSALTAADVAEAASIGQGAGKFVFWGKAEVLAVTPKTITLGTAGKPTATYSVRFVAAA